MTGDHQPASIRFIEYVARRASRPRVWTTSDHFLGRLSVADYVSLLALLTAWTGTLHILGGDVHGGILIVLVAVGLDKLDGYVARTTDTASPFGRRVDSFIDVFAYLVPSALVVHISLAPNVVVSALVGFLIIGFGGLRLIRHDAEGFGTEGDVSFYRGTTVVHTAVLVVGNFVAVATFPFWNGWLAAVTIAAACPFMISDYRSYKTAGTQWIAGLVVLILAGLVAVIGYAP